MNIEHKSKSLVERITVLNLFSRLTMTNSTEPLKDGVTVAGKELTPGFMCYGLKFYL